MAKLTVLELRNLTSADAGKKGSEEGGLRYEVRANQSGVTVAFTYRYRFGGKIRELRLGVFPHMTLPEIRKARDNAYELVKQGKDPALEKKLEKESNKQAQQALDTALAEKAARLTVKELFDKWHKAEVSKRKDGGAEVKRAFEKDVLPRIGAMAAEDVTRKHIVAVLDGVLDRGANRMANQQLSSLRQMFGYGYAREIVENDPTHRLRKADIGGKEVERDRVLSEAEIHELHKTLPNAKLGKSSEIAIWIALSTCCRIGELLRAKWSDIDLKAGEWIIPEDNSKNAKAHTVYLSAFAKKHFQTLQALNASAVWVYPNREDKDHVCVKTVTKQIGDRQRAADQKPLAHRAKTTEELVLTGGKWTPHDLRRTGATLMASLGVNPDVIERCLNHTEENKIKRIYQRHDYKVEQKEAWKLLGERLELLTRDNLKNVRTGNFKRVV